MHPDRFANHTESERKFATQEFQRLTEAFEVLRENKLGGDQPPPRPESNRRTNPKQSPTERTVLVSEALARDGGRATCPSPRGKPITFIVKPGTKSGQRMRLKDGGDEILVRIKIDPTSTAAYRQFRAARDASDWPSSRTDPNSAPRPRSKSAGYPQGPEFTPRPQTKAKEARDFWSNSAMFIFACLVILVPASIAIIAALASGSHGSEESGTNLESSDSSAISISVEPTDSACSSELTRCWSYSVSTDFACESAVVSFKILGSDGVTPKRTETRYFFDLTPGQSKPMVIDASSYSEDSLLQITDTHCYAS